MGKKTDENNFIMSAKIDFAFKLIFGDENNKEVLVDLLSAILQMPIREFESIEYTNTELYRHFKEDKKGILDIRIKTATGKHIDIEIQLLNHEQMAERALFYWSKMFVGQIGSGDHYNKLKKCISINILGFEMIQLDVIHTKGQIWDINRNYKITDMLEIHFLELPKLSKSIKDEDDPAIQWLEFINAESEEVMEMLAENNKNIKRAYKVLKAASRDAEKRAAYEARQAALMDEASRLGEAIEKGKQEGIAIGEKIGLEKGIVETAIGMIKAGVSIELVSSVTKIPVDDLKKHTK